MHVVDSLICLGEGVMGTLHGPVICRPAVHVKLPRVRYPLMNLSSTKGGLLTSGFWGCRKKCRHMIRVGSLISQQLERRSGLVRCNFSSSSDGNGSMAENFSESDEDYVNSSVIEAGMMFMNLYY